MRAVTYAVEIAVGIGCLGAAEVARQAARGVIASVLAVAGLLAVGHGVWALARLA